MRPAPDPQELVQYYVVNTDLTMSAGKLGAQTAHAATVSTVDALSRSPDDPTRVTFERWLAVEQKKVLLGGSLADLERLAIQGGYLIVDNGHTEIPPGSRTVVALRPMARAAAAALVGGLRLYRR